MELKGKEFKEHSSGLFVSSDGEVFVPSTSNSKEHFTYGGDRGNGYLRVSRNGKIYLVHRLVAECFIPNLENLLEVDHIDRNPKNNNVENLRWASRSLQMINANHPKNTACSKKVLQLTLDGELVREWLSTAECGRNGFDQSTVSKCCNGKLPHYKKFIWRYCHNF